MATAQLQLPSKGGSKKQKVKSAKGRRSSRNRDKGKYARQRLRTERNKRIRRERHMARHPNDRSVQPYTASV